MNNESILLTGGDGALASYALGCTRLSKEEANITDPQVTELLVSKKPRAIIHTAAMTDQKACEQNPEAAYLINTIGAYHAVLAAKKAGALFCYVSTNAVFSGEKLNGPYEISDTPDPRVMYGRSKYAGECIVRGVLPHALIVRSSWIFGGGPLKDKKFVGAIMRQIQGGATTLRAIYDTEGTPTYGKDLMQAILTLLKEKKEGVIHITNAGSASRAQMAEALGERFGVPTVKVEAATFGTNIPKNEMLEGMRMRPWKVALEEYIQTEWQGA